MNNHEGHRVRRRVPDVNFRLRQQQEAIADIAIALKNTVDREKVERIIEEWSKVCEKEQPNFGTVVLTLSSIMAVHLDKHVEGAQDRQDLMLTFSTLVLKSLQK